MSDMSAPALASDLIEVDAQTRPIGRRLQPSALCLSLVARFGQKAASDLQIDDLFTDAAFAVAEGLGTEYAEVSQLDAASGQLVLRAGKGWQSGWMGRSIAGPIDESPSGQVLRSGMAVMTASTDCADYETSAPGIRACPLLSNHDVSSGLAVPIPGAVGTCGVLAVYTRKLRGFEPEQVDFLRAIANTLAAVIARKTAEQRLAQMSQTDALTGLPHRSLFLDRLSHGLTQAQRHRWRVGVLTVDLDRFKAINDALGHESGDELLRQAAQRLSTCVRASDTVGRLGNDEFAFVLSNVSWPDHAALVAQRVVDVLTQPFQIGGREVRVSASVGITVFPDDATSPDALLNGADSAMHAVRRSGQGGYQFFMPHMVEARRGSDAVPSGG